LTVAEVVRPDVAVETFGLPAKGGFSLEACGIA
jgi:hypothetical protein